MPLKRRRFLFIGLASAAAACLSVFLALFSGAKLNQREKKVTTVAEEKDAEIHVNLVNFTKTILNNF